MAVDNCFSGLIPKKELFGDTELRIGDQVTARVVKVLEDGKLTLSVREKAYLQIQKDAEKIERLLDSYEGSLPFNDKAAPEVIAHETGMSKNEFKRAVGHLLKRRQDPDHGEKYSQGAWIVWKKQKKCAIVRT